MMTDDRPSTLGVLLAGGLARRMGGGDKPMKTIGGRTILERVITRLAPQCDGVISVVRARRSTRGLLGRLREQLRSLNVEHLGVVLNAVRHHPGGYYGRNIRTYYAYTGNGNALASANGHSQIAAEPR